MHSGNIWVEYNGERALPLDDRISTLPLSTIHVAEKSMQVELDAGR